MGRVLDKLAENEDLPEVVPIFITVDPYRDSVDQLKEYMKGECREAALARLSGGASVAVRQSLSPVIATMLAMLLAQISTHA